jgi:hypothetical protein
MYFKSWYVFWYSAIIIIIYSGYIQQIELKIGLFLYHVQFNTREILVRILIFIQTIFTKTKRKYHNFYIMCTLIFVLFITLGYNKVDGITRFLYCS